MNMLSYTNKWLEKRKIKRHFKEYGTHVKKFDLEKEGFVEFTVWDNPLESPKSITQGMVDFYKQFVTEGCLAIDIGAHIGDTTIPIALAAGKTGTTLAFDPNPMVFKILEVNAKLNLDKTNIVPFNYAIAIEPGEYYFNSSEATHNNGGISKKQKNKHGKYQLKNKVTAVNLLDFLKKEFNAFLNELGFLKIDIEGMDLEILQSIKELIAKSRPTIIAECFKKLDQSDREKLFNLFEQIDFELFYLESFNLNGKIQKISKKEDMSNWNHFDFCAIPKEKSEAVFNKK
jgi:FkbM family methyltransferase